MNHDPALISLQLSATFIPGLNRASDQLREAYPLASDAELLERIFITGICATIDNPQKKTIKALRIIQCRDSLMWYAGMIGRVVPLLGVWPEAYKSLDNGGFTNRVEFTDAVIVEVPA